MVLKPIFGPSESGHFQGFTVVTQQTGGQCYSPHLLTEIQYDYIPLTPNKLLVLLDILEFSLSLVLNLYLPMKSNY